MHRQIKLSLWDAFSYYLTGWTVLAFMSVHLWAAGTCCSPKVPELGAAAWGLGAFLVPLLCGLLVEPMANCSGNIMKVIVSAPILTATIARWARKDSSSKTYQLTLRRLAEESIPAQLRSPASSYHWCKDYLVQEGVNTPFMSFLAKFGFYRNMSFLFAANAFSIPFLHGHQVRHILIIFILLLLAVVLGFRCSKFFDHMGEAVYDNYLIALERRKCRSGQE